MPRSRAIILGASLKNYARVDSIIDALQKITNASTIPTPVPDKPYRLSFLFHFLKTLGRVFTIHIPADTAFVAVLFPDNENVWLARLYRLLHRRRYKIIFDPFISIYDTYVYNKPLDALAYPVIGSLLPKWLRWYESRLFNGADILLTDTDNHGRYLTKTLGITKPWHKILISADEKNFVPSRLNDTAFWRTEPLRVLWYGKVSLMHGVDYIWQALEKLPAGKIVVTLIGDFSRFDQNKIKLWQSEGKLVYLPEKAAHYVGQAKIIEYIQGSHIALGMFGHTEKSTNVITNKEYEALCSGRCLVTLRGQREFLRHDHNCVMVDQNNPRDLIAALLALSADRKKVQRLANQGRDDYVRYASEERLTETLRTILDLELRSGHE
jgi:glycosyltransferase involved in cell wall biosynthesis